MDSLTQIVLGAAVGEVVAGKKIGNKALVWGAVGGTIPDLDVLLNPFLDPVQALMAHRGFSHSLFFVLLAAPLLGLLLSKIYKNESFGFFGWTKLFFWTLFTHPLLDIFTNYGTALFYPLSNYRVAFNTIFVIDPLYTLPLLLAVIITFFYSKYHKTRRLINRWALFISCGYLLFTVVNKIMVNRTIEEKLSQQHINYDTFMTVPGPLNNFLWSIIIKDNKDYLVGYYSILDQKATLDLIPLKGHHQLSAKLVNQQAINTLKFFSKGYFCLEEKENTLIFNDLRFGTVKGWFNLSAPYVFSFMMKNKGNNVIIERKLPDSRINESDLKVLWDRTKGNG